MKSADIRQQFLDYFAKQQHQIIPSSSLIPANDPTLLFTNAGMVPFKETFLGDEQRDYVRATSSQRCMRAGGKHNDLENVGYTARHHTFFEMLGNFSFGDYFKREAIQYAWTFLTEVLALPAEKLWITVFKDDKEAEAIWLNEIKIDPARFSRCGEKDNFWSMGDTGPCGPCSEIFYDHGADVAGGPPGSPEEDGDRYIEIWNLVFMQYNRSADGTLTPLAKQSVDTGMGLERLAAVLQGVHNNYDTDLFAPIIATAAKLANINDHRNQSLRVMADHIRSTAFLITDGIRPSNEGRGYVLRRIIRRAIRHGHKLGLKDIFFHQLLAPLIKIMGDAYPQLVEQADIIEQTTQLEEAQFIRTLDQGMKVLEQGLRDLSANTIPGKLVFTLYDTYGFPIDLTADIARERQLEIDQAGLDEQMTQQRQQSRAAHQFKQHTVGLDISGSNDFVGYQQLTDSTNIDALFQQQQTLTCLKTGEEGIIILKQTPFYGESGGQVGDIGEIRNSQATFIVEDTQKQGDAILHIGHVSKGKFELGQSVEAIVNAAHRRSVMLNHSATHLLHAALRKLLGKHVVQKGSLVAADYLRFDFSHPQPLHATEIADIENLVNEHIRHNHATLVAEMSAQQAQQAGAMALFGEKYGDTVRVLSMGEFSKELCGGTHVQYTGEIGLFKVTNETGIAAGIRRIEAVTAAQALAWQNKREQDLLTAIDSWKEKYKQQEKALQRLQRQLHQQQGDQLLDQAREIKGIKILAAKLEKADAKGLRETADQLKHKLGDAAVVVLATTKDNQHVSLIASVSKTLCAKLPAGELINHIAAQVGGKGGGRPDMAQAGGKHPEHLPQALASVYLWAEQKLGE